MIVLKFIAIFVPFAFLIMSPRMAAAAPCAGAAAGLVLWFLDSEEPPRFSSWAAFGAGVLIALVKGAPSLLLATLAPIAAFVILEYVEKKRGEGNLGALAPLTAAALVAGCGWLLIQSSSPRGAIGESPPTRIAVFGDSLTAGVANDGVEKPWPVLLQERLGQEAEVIAFAHPGDTASQSWNRWRQLVESGTWKGSDEWQPELFIVLLGGNDIRRRATPGDVKRDLEVWASALSPSGADVLFVAVPGGLIGDSYGGVWQSVAEEGGQHWMTEDAIRSILTSPNMKTDLIHFNQAGHEYFANAVYERIIGR